MLPDTGTDRRASGVRVRLAQTLEEVEAAQRLRYKVFYEERGAIPDAETKAARREVEPFDAIMDHLIVVDPARTGVDAVVGTYRLLRGEVLAQHGRNFYTSGEFDISPLLSSGRRLMELGRSCVLPEYRTLPVLQLLWEGIAAYVAEHGVDLMFGCASFGGTDVNAIGEQLAYLHHHHLAPPDLRPCALPAVYVDMNLRPAEGMDVRRARKGLEPLIKGYLRLGAGIGDGAFIDRQFNTIDVCIVMPTDFITRRYLHHYERRMQKPLFDRGGSEPEVPS